MKVIQLIDTLRAGGSERMSVNIANLFQENGIENILVATRESGPLQQLLNPEIKFYPLNKKSSFDVGSFLKLIKLVRSFKPTIIHAHSSSVIWAAFIKLIFPKIILIWHDHFGLSQELKSSSRPELKYISKLINGIISVNDVLRFWSINNLKFPASLIKTINNFPSIPAINKQAKGAIPTIICIANFRPQKNQLNLIEALHLLKQDGYEFKCELIGMIGDGIYFNQCFELIEKRNLKGYIQLYTNTTEMTSFLENGDIAVLSSDSEGLPVSLLEYGLAKLPVVCTNVGQCSEVLENGKSGNLVPPNDTKALSLALKDFISNPEEAAIKGNALYLHVKKNYTGSLFLKEYNLLLTSINERTTL